MSRQSIRTVMTLGAGLGLLLLTFGAARAARTARAQDSPSPRLDDAFLQNLIGEWTIERKIRGTVVHNTLKAEWVLQHQFVQLHMKDTAQPPEYEALVLVGYDPSTKRYLAHWCDSFGGQYAGVGYGVLVNNAIDFFFNYADGPFHNTFTWNPTTRSWKFLMESEGVDGIRQVFAEDTVRR